jgi:hypothetical protein
MGRSVGGRRKVPVGKCPRCGAPHYGITAKEVQGRTYLYAYHGTDGRGKPLYCYLGPADGYIAAESLHVLGLTNLEEVDPLQVAFAAASNYVVRVKHAKLEEPREAARRLRQLAEDIIKLAEDLERWAGPAGG